MGVVILDPILNVIFHSLIAELALKQEKTSETIIHLKKAEYYSLQQRNYLFAIYCMIEEADIFKRETNLERGLAVLNSALGLSTLV